MWTSTSPYASDSQRAYTVQAKETIEGCGGKSAAGSRMVGPPSSWSSRDHEASLDTFSSRSRSLHFRYLRRHPIIYVASHPECPRARSDRRPRRERTTLMVAIRHLLQALRYTLMAPSRMKSLINFVLDNSLLLLAGALGAIVWANVDMTTYERVARPLQRCPQPVLRPAARRLPRCRPHVLPPRHTSACEPR